MKLHNGEWDHSFDQEALSKRLLAAYAFYRYDCGGRVVPDSPSVARDKAISKAKGIKALVRHSQKPLQGKRRGNADKWLARLNEILNGLESALQERASEE